MARFGLHAMRPAVAVARSYFAGPRAQALFAGLAAHSILPLDARPSAAIGLVLAATAHTVGWPFPRGGSRQIGLALAAHLRSLGGVIETGRRVESLSELPSSRAVLCDVTPRQLLKIAGTVLPEGFRRKLAAYRYGPAAFKIGLGARRPHPLARARVSACSHGPRGRDRWRRSRNPSATPGPAARRSAPMCC